MASTLASGYSPGSGTIATSPSGIDCTFTLGVMSGTCTAGISWPINTTLYLDITAAPAAGSLGCAGEDSCGNPNEFTAAGGGDSLELQNGDSITAEGNFELTSDTLTLSRSGVGTGTVTSSPTGLSCGSTCSAEFFYGTTVTLKAVPDAGASFAQWTGACAGQGATCTLLTKAAFSTNAVFGLASQTTSTAKTTTAATTTNPGPTTTTVTTPATTTSPKPKSPAANQLEAQLIGVKQTRSRLGFRLIEVEITTGEKITADLTLVRTGKRLAHQTETGIRPGDRVVTLNIPTTISRGNATLHVTLIDAARHRRAWTRTIVITHT